ncbi:MAG TPA: hypothetical protein VE422_47200 [Terriglobia bacterium]|nr:hypothetical protein [Terriglobia bacterium]
MTTSMDWWTQTKDDLDTLRPVLLSFAILAVTGALGKVLNQPLELGLLAGVILGPVAGPMIGKWKFSGGSDEEVKREDQALYLDGKMKRYSLLFSVNGGAFAIAKLLNAPTPPGGLSIGGLSVGAIVFTVLMTADIWLWGAGMRKRHGTTMFRPVGQTILLMIGALLTSGWALVSIGRG